MYYSLPLQPELVAEKEKIQAKMEELIKADLPRLEISNQANVAESGQFMCNMQSMMDGCLSRQ